MKLTHRTPRRFKSHHCLNLLYQVKFSSKKLWSFQTYFFPYPNYFNLHLTCNLSKEEETMRYSLTIWLQSAYIRCRWNKNNSNNNDYNTNNINTRMFLRLYTFYEKCVVNFLIFSSHSILIIQSTFSAVWYAHYTFI